MTAPRPAGYRLALIHGNSLPEGADPVEGKRMKIDARGALPVEAIDAGEIVSLPRHGLYHRRRDRTARTLMSSLEYVLPALAKELPGS